MPGSPRSSTAANDAALSTSGKGRYAFVFYATTNTHAAAVLVAARRLRLLGVPPGTDLVVLTSGVSRALRRTLNDCSVLVVTVSPPAIVANRYFRHSLLKLRAFQLVQYERIALLDADSYLWSNLTKVLEAPIDKPIAMPTAYWLREPTGTSALMAIRPSVDNWTHLRTWLEHAANSGRIDPDMDVLNQAFAERIHYLPVTYLRLNSDWTREGVVVFHGPLRTPMQELQVFHFSDLGKPWFYPPTMVRWLRPDAREDYHRFWELWWRLRDDVIRDSRGSARAQLLALKYWAVFFQPLRAIARTVKNAIKRCLAPSCA